MNEITSAVEKNEGGGKIEKIGKGHSKITKVC